MMDDSKVGQGVPHSLTPYEKKRLDAIFANPSYFKRGAESLFDLDRPNGVSSEQPARYANTSGEDTIEYMIKQDMSGAIKDLILNLLKSSDPGADLDLQLLLKTLKTKGLDFSIIKLDPFEVLYDNPSYIGAANESITIATYRTRPLFVSSSALNRIARLYDNPDFFFSKILPPTIELRYALSTVWRYGGNSLDLNNLRDKMDATPLNIEKMETVFSSEWYQRASDALDIRDYYSMFHDMQVWLWTLSFQAVKYNNIKEFKEIISKIKPRFQYEDRSNFYVVLDPTFIQNILETTAPQGENRGNIEPFMSALFAQKYTDTDGQRKTYPVAQFDFEKNSGHLAVFEGRDTGEKTDSKAVIKLCIQNMKPITEWSPNFVEILKTRLTDWASIPALQPMLIAVLEKCPRNKIKKGEMEALLIPSPEPSPFTFHILRLHDNVGMAAKYLSESVGRDPAKSLDLKSATIDQLKSVFEETPDGCTRAPYMKSHQHVQDWLSVIAHHASHKASGSHESLNLYEPLLQSILIDCYKPGIFTRAFGMESRYKKILAHIEALETQYSENTGVQALAVL